MRMKAITGYETRYAVTDDGRVYSHVTGRFLNPSVNGRGYLHVNLAAPDGTQRSIRVHRLVAEAFLGPRPSGMHTCHNDGDKLNNSVSNLRYDTPAGNEADKVDRGLNQNVVKTQCPQGHDYDEANTRWRRTGGRACRACEKERLALYEKTRPKR